MATETVEVRVNAKTTGAEQVQNLKKNLQGMGDQVQKAQKDWQRTTAAFTAGSVAFYAVARGAAAAWSALKEGAAIERATKRFDNLAASVNTTGTALRQQLRDATSGMVSDVELMAAATDMLSLGLATTGEEAVRLTRLTGELGWNMQQLVLTLANMSTMRLDALGLSVAAVTTRAKELEIQGMAAQEAFKMAVIEAGEAKIAIEGSIADSAAGSVAKAEAAWKNFFDGMKLGMADLAEGVGLLGLMSEHGDAQVELSNLVDQLDRLVEAGRATEEQSRKWQQEIMFGGEAAGYATMMIDAMTKQLDADAAAAAAAAEKLALLAGAAIDADRAMLQSAGGAEQLAISTQKAAVAAAIAAYDIATAFGASSAAIEDYYRRGEAGANVNRRFAEATGTTKYELAQLERAAAGASRGIGGFSAALDEATQKQRDFASAFTTEINTELSIDTDNDALKERQKLISEGLINKEGLANMTAINAALYQQAQAAGASAGQLALLGIATGEFTEEQARAALKAALLAEKIKQMSQAVVAGDIGYADAVAGIGAFATELDTSAAQVSVEELAGAIDEYATGGPYSAEVDADTALAYGGVQDLIRLLEDDFAGRTFTAYTEVKPADGSAIPVPPPGAPPPGATPSAIGGNFGGGEAVWVGERGPELVTFNQPFEVHPYGQGGGDAIYTVNVTNYINGEMSRSAVDTVTEDKLKRALRSLGV